MSAEEKFQRNFSTKDKVVGSFENNGAVVDVCLVAEKDLEKCDIDKGETVSEEVIRQYSFKVDEEKKGNSNQYNCYTYLKQTAVLQRMERAILISVCIAIAAGFTVPIIIYAIDTDGGDNSYTVSLDIDVDSCQTLSAMSSDTQVC